MTKYINYISILLLGTCLLLVAACSTEEGELSEEMSEVIYVRNEGADMPAYVYGNGASKVFILVIHGGPGGNGLEYRCGQFANDLEEDYAMVYWDQRGQGSSHGHYEGSDVSVKQMVDDLQALVFALKFNYGSDISVFLMGHSWGGSLGTAYMITGENQYDVDGWIEVDGAHDIPLLNKEALKMFRRIGAAEILSLNNVSFWTEMISFAATAEIGGISIEEGGEINSRAYEAEGMIDDIEFSGCGGGLRPLLFSPSNLVTSGISGNNTSSLLLNEAETLAYTSRLKDIKQPCLFLWGKYDFVVPPALGESAYNNVGTEDKELIIFENSGHSPMDNEPDAFVEAVKTFVEKYK